jgi:hypothetical protein
MFNKVVGDRTMFFKTKNNNINNIISLKVHSSI